MLLEVIEFNRERNGFKWDKQLEIDMYAEEVKEFFDATTVAERLDALIDCEYVRFGTQCKMAYNGITSLPYDKDVEKIMVSSLLEEIPKEVFDSIIRKAEKIVCEINAQKGKKLKNGKVAKKVDLPNATLLIEDMLKEELGKYQQALLAQ